MDYGIFGKRFVLAFVVIIALLILAYITFAYGLMSAIAGHNKSVIPWLLGIAMLVLQMGSYYLDSYLNCQ